MCVDFFLGGYVIMLVCFFGGVWGETFGSFDVFFLRIWGGFLRMFRFLCTCGRG